MFKLLKAFGIFLLTISILVILIYVWVLFETKIRLKNYPEIFNNKLFLVKANYELESISIDDLVIIQENASINKGDIVLYLNNNSAYDLARIEAINSVSVTLKHDNKDDEATMNNSVIIGKATKRFVRFGKIMRIFKNKLLIVILLVVGFILTVFAQEKLSKPKQLA